MQVARAIELDDSLQVLLAPILLALGPRLEISVILLSLGRPNSHVLTPPLKSVDLTFAPSRQ